MALGPPARHLDRPPQPSFPAYVPGKLTNEDACGLQIHVVSAPGGAWTAMRAPRRYAPSVGQPNPKQVGDLPAAKWRPVRY